jgi:hypothetical protein
MKIGTGYWGLGTGKRINIMLCVLGASLALAFGSGCQSIRDYIRDKIADKITDNPAAPGDDDGGGTPAAEADARDDVALSALRWAHGGYTPPSGAALDRVIASARYTPRKEVSLATPADLWGATHEKASAIFCMFYEQPDGTWVGGKLDWISPDRKVRDLAHIYGAKPYNGWEKIIGRDGGRVAIVIYSQDGKHRTNVRICA